MIGRTAGQGAEAPVCVFHDLHHEIRPTPWRPVPEDLRAILLRAVRPAGG